MINWRIIVGLVLLFFGIKQLYAILGSTVKSTPVYVVVGCVIWVAAGTFLIIKGLAKKPE